MNLTEYTYLINKPDAVNERHTESLEKIVEEFPFFQSARALRLKALYNEDSFKYNYALKVTAAHTTDRSVLFDFITSDTFTAVQKDFYDQKTEELHDIRVKEGELITAETIVETAPIPEPVVDKLEQSILTSIREASPVEEIQEVEIPTEEIFAVEETVADSTIEFVPVNEIPVPEIAEIPEFIPVSETAQPENVTEEITETKLDIGKPLEFSKTETHSFQEWLQLSKIQPIERAQVSDAAPEITPTSDSDLEKQKKNELIDKFIETSPKIPPVRPDAEPSFIFEPSKAADNSYLMTETLARVYLEQKKYQKAIQAYQILILKYPEKSSFFADRILDIKSLQQNNNK